MAREKKFREKEFDYLDRRLDTEIKRIDALRAEDCEHVKIANESAFKQAVLLQQEVSRSAEVLREAVAKTADTIARQFSQVTEEMYKRISILEKIQYEFQGKNLSTPDLAKVVNDLVAKNNVELGRNISTPDLTKAITELVAKENIEKGRHQISTPLLATLSALAGGLLIFLLELLIRSKGG